MIGSSTTNVTRDMTKTLNDASNVMTSAIREVKDSIKELISNIAKNSADSTNGYLNLIQDYARQNITLLTDIRLNEVDRKQINEFMQKMDDAFKQAQASISHTSGTTPIDSLGYSNLNTGVPTQSFLQNTVYTIADAYTNATRPIIDELGQGTSHLSNRINIEIDALTSDVSGFTSSAQSLYQNSNTTQEGILANTAQTAHSLYQNSQTT